MASDTGLCGAYNANMEKKLHEVLDEYAHLPRENITLYPVGIKMLEAAKKTVVLFVTVSPGSATSRPDYLTCERLSKDWGSAICEEG